MPIKERHFVVSLGDTTTTTPESDLSSANWAFLYGKTTSGSSNIFEVQACPLPFGETPDETDWYRYGKSMSIATAENVVVAIPPATYGDYCTPRRVRVKVTAGGLDNVFIEGIREIA